MIDVMLVLLIIFMAIGPMIAVAFHNEARGTLVKPRAQRRRMGNQ